MKNIIRKILKESYLFENRVDDMKLKYPGYETDVDYFVENDPSGNNKYLIWAMKQLVSNNEDVGIISSLIKNFHKNNQRLDKKDINQYKTISELLDDLNKLKPSRAEERKQIKREGAETIYEDDDVLVLKPLTHKASCIYGAGTKWCITMKDTDRYWKSYTEKTENFAGTGWYESQWVEERIEPNFIQRLMGQKPTVVKKEIQNFTKQFPRNIIYFVIFKRRISGYTWNEKLKARIPSYVPVDPKNPMNKLAFLYKPDRADYGDLSWSKWFREGDTFGLIGDMLDASHNNLSVFNSEDKKVTLREINKEFGGEFGYILAHMEYNFKKEQSILLGYLEKVLDKVFPLLGAEGSKRPTSWITGKRYGNLNVVPSDMVTKGKNNRDGKMVSWRNSRNYKQGND